MNSFFIPRIILLIIFAFSSMTVSANSLTDEVGKYFESIKKNPKKLEDFLQAFPKGADLHTHISGASLPENLIEYARGDQLCMDKTTLRAYVSSECAMTNTFDLLTQDVSFKETLIDAWSMRHFKQGKESGHDHLFSAFGKFGVIAHAHQAAILNEVVTRANAQHISYIEAMLTPDDKAAAILGKKVGWTPDFEKMRLQILGAEFEAVLALISERLNQHDNFMHAHLGCHAASLKKDCEVTLRYLYQAHREQAPEAVFAELLAGFEAATKDPRIVGVNLVQPEDGPVAMRDYDLHMQMIHFFRTKYPNVKMSLHAGEIMSQHFKGSNHIRKALSIAKPDRIGHGSDIAGEDNSPDLMEELANKKTLVEINLTSNDYVLSLSGKDHPLPLYLQNHVPVALSTDDEGVTRSPLTLEFMRAVQTYQLSYLQLKTLARNSLHFSFLPGESLWMDANYRIKNIKCRDRQANICNDFLQQNEKAAMEQSLEEAFNQFEASSIINAT